MPVKRVKQIDEKEREREERNDYLKHGDVALIMDLSLSAVTDTHPHCHPRTKRAMSATQGLVLNYQLA